MKMSKEEKIIREYFDFEDVNQSEPISVLPLTLVDMLLEYESELKILNKPVVRYRIQKGGSPNVTIV